MNIFGSLYYKRYICRIIYIRYNMKLKHPISRFLRECLANDIIVRSWGITKILINEAQISFCVSGFNFSGLIIITSQNESLIIRSEREYLGTFQDPKNAISKLDKYIEFNEDEYNKLSSCENVKISAP